MYVRFITPWWQVRQGVDYGLFGPAGECEEDVRTAEALRVAIRIELDWFNSNLPVPPRDRFEVKSRKRWLSEGICWFVDDAREMIARAFTLAWLLRECGVPVAKVATRRPGQILYRDAWQIVAKPEKATPTAWC
jgi:hypothetical protein